MESWQELLQEPQRHSLWQFFMLRRTIMSDISRSAPEQSVRDRRIQVV